MTAERKSLVGKGGDKWPEHVVDNLLDKKQKVARKEMGL